MNTLRRLAGCLFLAVTFLCGVAAETNKFNWRDARELTLEGRGWSDTKDFYDRLPARAEGKVRSVIWGLSHDTAGMAVYFTTDATSIAAQWRLRKEALAMPHMPATGVSGLDLYVKDKGSWHWIGNGRPLKATEEKTLVSGLAPGQKEFVLYLPLYNGVHEVKIGVPTGAKLEPLARPQGRKPIVFYGTSILQGGCASRPGMAYPSILGRRLDWPTINLGFSGSAHCEPEVAELLAELNPAVYVIDPLANMTVTMVSERMENLILTLRRTHPDTPIVMVENANYPDEAFLPKKQANIKEQNARLKRIFERLTKAGQKKIFYFRADKFFGDDGEATVDGTHPTDLGFVRMADAIEPTVRKALKAAR